jgi:hypothetical protein
MQRRNKTIVICIIVFFSLAIAVIVFSLNNVPNDGIISNRNFVVPDDYETITDAVGNATEGSMIYLRKGTYNITETLAINKTISLVGEDQAKTTIIAPPDARSGFAFFAPKIAVLVTADNFKVANLTIINSDIEPEYGIKIIGNGTQMSNITTRHGSITGNHCKIYDNTLSYQLDINGEFNDVKNNSVADLIQCHGTSNRLRLNSGGEPVGQIAIQGELNIIENNSNFILNLYQSNSNKIFCNNVGAVWLSSNSNNNTVFGNIIKGNAAGTGIEVSGSNNVFYGNYIGDFRGIMLNRGETDSYGYAIQPLSDAGENNLFYHNNFINNYQNILVGWSVSSSGFRWDNGLEGNYWDGYHGSDTNGDGIGETEYAISGIRFDSNGEKNSVVFGIDYHPLMVPFNISSIDLNI